MRNLLLLSLIAALWSCGSPEIPNAETVVDPNLIGRQLLGEAQGTTYHITYLGDTTDYQPQIDSLLDRFDQDLSTWRPGSLINQINAHNRRDTVFGFVDSTRFFSAVFDLSREIYLTTDGAFDPTVLPLIKGWGFQLEQRSDMNQQKVDSLLAMVDFSEYGIDIAEFTAPDNEYLYSHTEVIKLNPNVQLDFNAIAQGYSIDLIGDLLRSYDITNFMVELGGEVLCSGTGTTGGPWRIAIDKPEEGDTHSTQAVVSLSDKALATSGNYRKFYEEDGQRYSHIVNPKTGYPAQNTLLSATVMADNCGVADAYATALMVLGEDAIPFLQNHPELGLEAYLIFDQGGQLQVVVTPGMAPLVEGLEIAE